MIYEVDFDFDAFLGNSQTSDFLINSVTILVVVIDKKANVVCLNQQASKTLGYTNDNLKGQSWFDVIVYKGDQQRVEHELECVLAGGDIEKSDWVAVTRNGDKRFISWKLTAIEQNEEIVGALYLGIDKTDIQKVELALEESQQRFQTIFDNLNDAVFVQDPIDGTILDVNQRACELYGYNKEEIKKLKVVDLSLSIAPFDVTNARDKIREAASGIPQFFEWHAQRKDGELFWVEVNAKQTFINKQKVVLVTVRDISEKKRTQDVLSRTQLLLIK